MMKIDLETVQGRVHAQWRKKGPDSYLSLHRKDGSRILRIHADYADEADLVAAAHALNKVFKHGPNTETKRNSGSDRPADLGDGGEA